jgi:hypothetical protein
VTSPSVPGIGKFLPLASSRTGGRRNARLHRVEEIGRLHTVPGQQAHHHGVSHIDQAEQHVLRADEVMPNRFA